jgi:transposase-like protein
MPRIVISPEEKERWWYLHVRDGLPPNTIARRFGISAETVGRYLRKRRGIEGIPYPGSTDHGAISAKNPKGSDNHAKRQQVLISEETKPARQSARERIMSMILPQRQLLSGAEIQCIENQLLENIRAARAEYAEAKVHFREAVNTQYEVECADGTFATRHTVRSETAAREKYVRAVKAHADFVLRGEVPES